MPSPALCYRRCCEESLAWGHRLLVSLKREGLLVYEGKGEGVKEVNDAATRRRGEAHVVAVSPCRRVPASLPS